MRIHRRTGFGTVYRRRQAAMARSRMAWHIHPGRLNLVRLRRSLSCCMDTPTV
ncbi:MAG: hypothetical protein AB1772_01625 [Candidatus Zixiibacteriota bacterium]